MNYFQYKQVSPTFAFPGNNGEPLTLVDDPDDDRESRANLVDDPDDDRESKAYLVDDPEDDRES